MTSKTPTADLNKCMNDQQHTSSRPLTRSSAFCNAQQSSPRHQKMAIQQSSRCKTESKPHATHLPRTAATAHPSVGFGCSETRHVRHTLRRRSGGGLAQLHPVVLLQNQRPAVAAVVYAGPWCVG